MVKLFPHGSLAGIVYTEAGGADPIKKDVFKIRSGIPGGVTAPPLETSIGGVAIQLRRAAEALRYDVGHLTPGQVEALVSALIDPVENIFIVAAHLSDLREVVAPGAAASEITIAEMRDIAVLYQLGPGASPEARKKHAGYDFDKGRSLYGLSFLRHLGHVRRLVLGRSDVPRP